MTAQKLATPARAEATCFSNGPGMQGRHHGRPCGALPDRAGSGRGRESTFTCKAGNAAHTDDFEPFFDRKRVFLGAPAGIMSISGIAISGRGAPNPAQGQRFVDFPCEGCRWPQGAQ